MRRDMRLGEIRSRDVGCIMSIMIRVLVGIVRRRSECTVAGRVLGKGGLGYVYIVGWVLDWNVYWELGGGGGLVCCIRLRLSLHIPSTSVTLSSLQGAIAHLQVHWSRWGTRSETKLMDLFHARSLLIYALAFSRFMSLPTEPAAVVYSPEARLLLSLRHVSVFNVSE